MRDAKRPRLLWIPLWLMFAQGAMYLTYFVLYLFYAETSLHVSEMFITRVVPQPQRIVTLGLLVGTWLALGIASVIIGVGLRGGRPWAWTAALTLQGAIFILALEAYFNRKANEMFYVAMAIGIAITLLLNQREIQIFYRATRREAIEGRFGR